MNATKLVIVASAIALFIAACSQSSQAPANSQTGQSSSPATATKSAPSDAEVGAKLYAENCQICHKDTGKGGKDLTIEGKKISPEDLTSDKLKKKSDADLVKEISEGVTDEGMPAFKDKLSPDQMKQIVLHVRRLQTPIANS
jgi:mono/diheme cytochrome c family protein